MIKKLIKNTFIWKIRLNITYVREFLLDPNRSNYNTLLLFKLFFNGFTPTSYRILNINNISQNKYLSDWRRIVLFPDFSHDDTSVLDDKNLFSKFMLNYPLLHNETVDSIDDFIKLSTYVIKPTYGLKGRDILFVKKTEDGYIVNNVLQKSLKHLDLSNSLIVKYIKQEKFLASIYPTTNTIRILTVKDPRDDQCVIHSATLRMGTDKSNIVDSFSQGGCIARVAIENGIIGDVKCIDGYVGREHPDSGVTITDNKIHNWEMIKKDILKLANDFKVPYIGWDIIVTEDGFKVIEGNNKSDALVTQVAEAIFSNDATIRLFNKYKK